MTISQTRRGLLREASSGAHGALDAAVGSLDSLDTYRHYLRGTYAFRVPMERLLGTDRDWQVQSLAPALEDDLADLNLPRPAVGQFDGPLTASRRLGVLYVLEGSALGSRMLVKQAAGLGLGAAFGARHLVQQSEDRSRWPAFVDYLEGAEDIDLDAMVDASLRAFRAAMQAFESPAHV